MEKDDETLTYPEHLNSFQSSERNTESPLPQSVAESSVGAPDDSTKCISNGGPATDSTNVNRNAIHVNMPYHDDVTCSRENSKLPCVSADSLINRHDDSKSCSNAPASACQQPVNNVIALSRINSSVHCYDVAISHDGQRLLLATLQHGLKEYDLSGNELSTWLPDEREGPDEVVNCVDALDKGAAVGLGYSKCVVLLSRSEDQGIVTWKPDNPIDTRSFPPWCISAHESLVAVAEYKLDDNNELLPGPQLVLLCFSERRVVASLKLDYDIYSLAVTANAVVAASLEKVKLTGCQRRKYVVDCYDHKGTLQWRMNQDEPVYDLVAYPHSQVLYLAFRRSNRVTAVSADDGRMLKNVLDDSSNDPKEPIRLSVSRGQNTILAVLSADLLSISVFASYTD